ncbi:phage antirepressor KilAC domain-containing protein [Streptomyces sp. NPDC058914]|uniref:phage antirepressor KilAC domain-containing protein n=1 Tax=Streptomyces sp. NPDC058914 TaxID=3346671 RepID=UPI0036B72DDB
MATIAPPNELVLFQFDGAQFPVIPSSTPSGQALAVAPICRHLGIDAEGQRQVIASRPWAQGMTCETQVMLPGENRSYTRFCLDIRRFAMWMATIQTGKLTNSEARQRIELWQDRAADALDEYLRTGQVEPEARRIPSTFAEALELAAAQARELEQTQAALEAATPKIEAHDRLIADGDDRILRTIAAELRVKEHWLRQQLVEWGWIYVRTADCGALQYAAYASKRDYFATKEKEIPHHSRGGCWHATLLVTPRGREAIRRKLDKQNAEPATPIPPRAIAPAPTEAQIYSMIRRGA